MKPYMEGLVEPVTIEGPYDQPGCTCEPPRRPTDTPTFSEACPVHGHGPPRLPGGCRIPPRKIDEAIAAEVAEP